MVPCGVPAQNGMLRSESAAVRSDSSFVEMSCSADLRAFSTDMSFDMRVSGARSIDISCVTIEEGSKPEARPEKLMPFELVAISALPVHRHGRCRLGV